MPFISIAVAPSILTTYIGRSVAKEAIGDSLVT